MSGGEPADFKVACEVASGREALAAAREYFFDIAILAYSLPELNGADLARALKRDSPGTKALLYTRHDRDEIVSDVLTAGVRGFVLKSDPDQHLLVALDALSVGRPYFSPAISDALLTSFLESRPQIRRGGLTPREREIVQLVAEGRLNKQIADRLRITLKTVETHRASAMCKLKLRTTADLVRWAVRHNLIQA